MALLDYAVHIFQLYENSRMKAILYSCCLCLYYICNIDVCCRHYRQTLCRC